MNPRAVPGMALAVLFFLFFILVLAMPVVAFEVILQGIMILSAVMSIILLLGPGRSRGGLS